MVLRATKPEFNTRSSLREPPYKELDPSIDYSVTKDPGIRTGRNMVINGCMRFSQRATTYTPASTAYGSLDRWKAVISQGSKISISQASDGIIPNNLSNYYAHIQVAATHSVGTSQFFLFWQSIEGNIFSQSQFGSAEAKPLTLSFWVRSNAKGKFGGSLENNAQNRSFPWYVDIEELNEWEYKTVHIPPCRDGTWNTTTSAGAYLMFSMGTSIAGGLSNYDWQGSQKLGPVEEVRRVELFTSTYVDITGVQLEVGSEASPFDYKSYQEEFALCQRYFNVWPPRSGGTPAWPVYTGGSQASAYIWIPYTMRAIPTPTDKGTGTSTTTGHAYNNNGASVSTRYANGTSPTLSCGGDTANGHYALKMDFGSYSSGGHEADIASWNGASPGIFLDSEL